MITLYPIDKQHAIKRIKEMNKEPFLTEEQQAQYEDAIDIILSYNAQFNRGAGKAYHLPTNRKDLKL